ncbi:MAG: hypothetical protein KBG48_20655 [Kofleriaceae bacterium]|jgi:hypothetical protein|nr:hypothetical protein [Kofleriaceae bacterium]MBP9169826.1 hypothetical protein [Kofleriaceae bacterium]MBP9858083.1 hypothetical protein [Kofleriaceae bacterium]
MLRSLALASAVVAATGCQTFVGIEDVDGHLPYVDAEYLIGLKRARADGSGDDVIRLRGTATLDPDRRALTLSLNQLSFTTGQSVAENAIAGVVFADGPSAEFDLSLTIQPGAVEGTLAPADATVSARMRMTLEGDFAICATPVSGGALPSIGSIVVDPATATPTGDRFDTACDDL